MRIIRNQMVKEKGLGRGVQANNLRRVKKRIEDVNDSRKAARYSENSMSRIELVCV